MSTVFEFHLGLGCQRDCDPNSQKASEFGKKKENFKKTFLENAVFLTFSLDYVLFKIINEPGLRNCLKFEVKTSSPGPS